MSGCICTGRPGCRGSLCRSARTHLRQLPVTRYPAGDDGLPDLSSRPVTGWICALVGHGKAAAGSSIDIPGTTVGEGVLRLTAAAGSLEPPLLAGDRVTVDGALLAVTCAGSSGSLTAELIPLPTEEAE